MAIDQWTMDESIGAALIRRARSVVMATLQGRALPAGALDSQLVPVHVAGAGVTLYRQGVLGCSISAGPDLDQAIRSAAVAAATDRRYPRIAAPGRRAVRVAVALLYAPKRVGPYRQEIVAPRLRWGRDSLAVSDGKRYAIYLDSVGPHYGWTRKQLMTALLRKARLADKALDWTTYSTATWLEHGPGARTQEFGFCVDNAKHHTPAMLQSDLKVLGWFLAANLDASAERYRLLQPITGRRGGRLTDEQASLAYCALWQAGRRRRQRHWQHQAEAGLSARARPRLANALLFVSGTGDVRQTERQRLRELGSYLVEWRAIELERYRGRGSLARAGWVLLTCSALHRLEPQRSQVLTAFEVADECMARQHANGAFAGGLEEGSATTTALVAAGLADAWLLATHRGERRRAARYHACWLAALGFLRPLILRPEDGPMLKDPARTIGGVRLSPTNPVVETDAVSYLALALSKGQQARL